MPDFHWFVEAWKKGWPVIEGAPLQFFIALSLSTMGAGTLLWAYFRERLKLAKETSDFLKDRILNLERQITESSAKGAGVTVSANNHANATATATGAQRKTRPKIAFLSTEYVDIHPGVDHFSFYRSPNPAFGQMKGLIVSFRNESQENVAAYQVTATARFTDAKGDEIGTGVAGILWLDGATDTKNILPDHSASLLLMIVSRTRDGDIGVPAVRRQHGRRIGTQILMPTPYTLPTVPHKVEIRLRDGSNEILLPAPLVLSITKRGANVEARQLIENS